MARLACLMAGVVLTAVAGCGGRGADGPRTYPVTGKVLLANNRPMEGGVVQFQPEADPTLTTVGEIGKGGTFTLSTVVGSRKVAGAVAGLHRVTVIPAQGADQKALPVVLAKRLEVKADGATDLVIQLPRAR